MLDFQQGPWVPFTEEKNLCRQKTHAPTLYTLFNAWAGLSQDFGQE